MFINGHMKLVIIATSDDESIIVFKRLDTITTEFIVATNVMFKDNTCKWSYASYYGNIDSALKLFNEKIFKEV